MEYNYDILLEYLSRKKSGKGQEFKTIVQNLNYEDSFEISYNEIRRMLSSLGHVEFLFNDDGQIYSVAPPGIALFNSSFKGVLCGYRTTELIDTLKKEFIEYNIMPPKEIIQKTAPKAIFVDFENNQKLDYFLKNSSLNLYVTKNFSRRLLKSLPTIDMILANAKKENFTINLNASNIKLYDVFNGKKIQTKNSGLGEKDYNLYERQFWQKYEYFIYLDDNYHKIDKNYGECITYSKLNKNKKYLKYSNNKLQISTVNLPELIDRALTLSSGLNRQREPYQYKKYIYDNIDLEFAKLVSEKTGLLLGVKNG